MKSILFRSIGVSLFVLSLSVFAFADGDMGAGSKTCTGGGSAPISTTEITTDLNIDSNSNEDSTSDFFGWFEKIFTDVLN